MAEQHWSTEPFDRPESGGDSGHGKPPLRPGDLPPGRTIKVVPPPSSQRYQHARPTRIPTRQSRRKQPV
jgi:hypothetical protein